MPKDKPVPLPQEIERLFGWGSDKDLSDSDLLQVLWLEPPRIRRRSDRRRAARLAALVELAKRIALSSVPKEAPLSRPQDLARYLFLRYARPDQEILGAIYLDERGRWLGERCLFRGGLSRAIVEATPILQMAMAFDARKLLIFHNHPNGDPEPSDNDFDFTYLLDFAAAEVGLALVDHWVLVGPNQWRSIMRDH